MRVCIQYQCCVYVVYSVAVGPPHGLLAWSSEVNDSQFGWTVIPQRCAPDSSFPTLLRSGLTCDIILVNYMSVYIRCHGSYMSVFDACVSVIAMFNLDQMNVILRQAWLCSLMLPILQPSSVLDQTSWLFCAVRVALGVLSSADRRWAQLWTSMQLALACMCAQVDTSCYVTPVCGMFAFGDTMYRLLCLTTGCYEYMHEWPWKCLSMLWASFACRPRSVFASRCTSCPCTPDCGMLP